MTMTTITIMTTTVTITRDTVLYYMYISTFSIGSVTHS